MGKGKKKDKMTYLPWTGLTTGWDRGKCFVEFVDNDEYHYAYLMTPKVAEALAKCLFKVAKKARKEKKK